MPAEGPTSQQIEIARNLGINAHDLAERVALNSADTDGSYITTSVNKMPGIVAFNQLDADQNSSDPLMLLAVLGRKVEAARGAENSQLEAAARNIAAVAQRLLEKCIGRKQA
jgi:hypothetical protein